MTSVTTKAEGLQLENGTAAYLFDNWFDPIETGILARVREFINELIRQELDAALARPRYGRRPKARPPARKGLPALSATGMAAERAR